MSLDELSANPYLEGNFAPVREEVTVLDLAVEGSLPVELDGLLLRNGPNPYAPGPHHHWFLGDGMVHGIRLRDGRAEWYRNRWVRTDRLAEVSGLPSAPPAPVRAPMPGPGAVNVIGHAGRILALGEVGLPWRLSPELDTEAEHDFDGTLASNVTAHPKLDPVTGEMVFFGYDFGPVNLRYHVADPSGRVVHAAEITTPRSTMMHDVGVTATRTVFMDLPVVFDLDVVAAGRMMPFRWDPSAGARLGVLPRFGGDADVRWIELPPCYVFHPFNAHDDGDRIVMDVVRYPAMFDVDLLGPAEPVLGSVVRWVIDPAAGTVGETVLDDRPQEFPRVDPRVETRPHRYGYSVSTATPGRFEFGEIRKRDLATGDEVAWDPGPGRHPGEAVFVPRTVDAAEDDGWLLAVVYDEATDRSEVVVLAAQDLAGGPIARVPLPVRVPYGFHGNWVPA